MWIKPMQFKRGTSYDNMPLQESQQQKCLIQNGNDSDY